MTTNKVRNPADIKAQMEELQKELDQSLKVTREEDLKTVRELCKQHGFTQTDLRGVLKTRKKKASS